MQNKKGLSTVVSTIILVLLIIAAIGIIWAVISNLLTEGSNKIEFGGLTIDLVLKNVTIDYDTGIATVQVTRNADGLGEEIVSIKFIVEDLQTGEVFEREVTNFVELSSRTFELNLTENGILNLPEVYKISIAAVYIPGIGGGTEQTPRTGSISDIIINLNKDVIVIPDISPEETICTIDSDCGTEFWVENTKICNGDNTAVYQYKTTYPCIGGFCTSSTDSELRETCASGYICLDATATCVLEAQDCVVETDCGTDGFIGFSVCASNPEAIAQDYRTYSCVNSQCQSSTTLETITECPIGEICFNTECFIPLECTTDEDCLLNSSFGAGYVCETGSCVPETVILNGSILTAWPFGIGEYFDSQDLPLVAEENYIGLYIIFPTSLETRCLKISNFVDAPTNISNSYIQLNESETNITAGNYFEAWKTDYGCTFI